MDSAQAATKGTKFAGFGAAPVRYTPPTWYQGAIAGIWHCPKVCFEAADEAITDAGVRKLYAAMAVCFAPQQR